MAFVKVDFSKEHRDLVKQGLEQILSQYKNSCVLLRFFEAFLQEVQVLFDAIHAARAGRQLATATDYNLDALGRIVGALRTSIYYEMLTWLYTETPHRITDETPVWVKNGALIAPGYMLDEQFRKYIWYKILKNKLLTGSVVEVTEDIKLLFGVDISFDKIDPYTVELYVQSNVSDVQLLQLIQFIDTMQADRTSIFPWPVTLSFSPTIHYVTPGGFMPDRSGVPYVTDSGPVDL